MEIWRNVSLDLITRELDGIIYVEEFRPVIGFEGYYEVSSFGRIKKLGRPYKTKREWKQDRITLAAFTSKKGKKKYLKFNLTADGKKKTFFAHRLVGLHFIELVEGKDHINHKTGVKTDNHYTQLEWCTHEENNAHAVSTGLAKRGQKPPKPYIKKGWPEGIKKIINIKTGEVYAHVKELSEKTGKSIKSLRRSLIGERYNHTDFRYLGQEDRYKAPIPRIFKKDIKLPVARFDDKGRLLQQFSDIKDVGDAKERQYARAVLDGRQSPTRGYLYKIVLPDGSFNEPVPFVSKKKERVKSLTPPTPGKGVIKRDKEGVELERFTSIWAAAKSMGSDDKNFKRQIRYSPMGYCKGFFWEIVG